MEVSNRIRRRFGESEHSEKPHLFVADDMCFSYRGQPQGLCQNPKEV